MKRQSAPDSAMNRGTSLIGNRPHPRATIGPYSREAWSYCRVFTS